jgi:hypothetical protein
MIRAMEASRRKVDRIVFMFPFQGCEEILFTVAKMIPGGREIKDH